MTFPTTLNHRHEVAPARLASPGAVAHKDRTLMSNENRTDATTHTTAAERAFWDDLRQFAQEHDTGDLSLAAKLVHDAASRAARPRRDDSAPLDVSTFRQATAWRSSIDDGEIDRTVSKITETVTTARRLDAIEAKLNAVLAAIGTGPHQGDTIALQLERVESDLTMSAIAALKRDRLVLEAVEGATGRKPAAVTESNLEDYDFNLDTDDALGLPTQIAAADLLEAGGVLPITINDDGTRRA